MADQPVPKQKPFAEQLALKEIGENEYEMINLPQMMGNPLGIAYGGYAIAVACKAASLTVPEGYHLYSMQGNYLGPAYTDRPLRASVRTVRQTRTFATRQVEISQTTDGKKEGKEGEKRVCLLAIADFMVAATSSLLEYTPSPLNNYPNWKDCPTPSSAYSGLVAEGKVPQQMLDGHAKGFNILNHLYDQRLCPNAIFTQNVYGMAKQLPHTQDHLPPSSRTTADWIRSKEVLPRPIDHITALTFLIDTAIAFLPLSFNHCWFDDVSAVSSLDFSLRIFVNEIDVNAWLLRELRAPVAARGRSFGEAWIWDEEGRAVACMSQQSILRPAQKKAKGKL
jgi:acyl-CoA thioesterase II